ncbi:MAG: hypothetical protein U1C48_03385 [Methylotenera sp.]|nr:hypothetical protein [Methylotenera sp.]
MQGTAATQEDKEKILLCCGNVTGVENVQDQLNVAEPVFYTVISGDTLSKIAKTHYGNANLYMKRALHETENSAIFNQNIKPRHSERSEESSIIHWLHGFFATLLVRIMCFSAYILR